MGQWKAFKKSSGTGQKELECEAGSGWKALAWESVAIDVGGACEDRDSTWNGAYTALSKLNPANVAGTITNVAIWLVVGAAVDTYVGIFYLVSGTTYKCRSAANLGTVTAGSCQNKAVSLVVQTGDLIGIFGGSDVQIERSTIGEGLFYLDGNKCIVDNESTYVSFADADISCYGTG